MSNLVIVAIPAEDDYVNRISSEKVPHMTMLFLGDVEGKPVAKIADFLQHAVSILELGPFGLEVDRRGKLGTDEADVVFFQKDPWAFKRIAEFRGQLLKDNNIKSAYDSVEQFPEWQPHLTLGYPATPAREDKRDYPGIHWVQFDKIALWYGDYTGLEFQLRHKYYDAGITEVAMSSLAERGEAAIKHFGVKGMRWGVRRERTPVSTTAKNTAVLGKTKVKAKGGTAQPAAPDAIKAAEHKQKLKKSGPAALSNQELRDLATRLQLEQQVTQLAGVKGQKFVKDTLATTGKQQVQRVASAKATQAVDATVLKRK